MLPFLLYRVLCGLFRRLVGMGVDDRDLEIAVQRHQLRILRRRGKRPRYRTADRALLAAASRFLPRERWSAFPVAPDTFTRVAPAAPAQEMVQAASEARTSPDRSRGPRPAG